MAKVDPAKLVENIYKRGRSYREFVGFVGETQKTIPTPKWELDAKNNSPLPQDPVDARAPNYDNNVDPKGNEGWLRGYGGKMHPHFDASPKSKKPY